MNIIFNGERRALSAENLLDALHELGLGDMKVATAVNGEFVPATLRADTVLNEGDTVEALSSMQGG